MDTEISRYLVDANGNSFSSDTDLQSLSKNAKVKNTNSGVSYKKVQGTSVPVFDKVPFQEGQPDAVLYSQQTLTSSQKEQARANIGAIDLATGRNNFVSTTSSQSFDISTTNRILKNIGIEHVTSNRGVHGYCSRLAIGNTQILYGVSLDTFIDDTLSDKNIRYYTAMFKYPFINDTLVLGTPEITTADDNATCGAIAQSSSPRTYLFGTGSPDHTWRVFYGAIGQSFPLDEDAYVDAEITPGQGWLPSFIKIPKENIELTSSTCYFLVDMFISSNAPGSDYIEFVGSRALEARGVGKSRISTTHGYDGSVHYTRGFDVDLSFNPDLKHDDVEFMGYNDVSNRKLFTDPTFRTYKMASFIVSVPSSSISRDSIPYLDFTFDVSLSNGVSGYIRVFYIPGTTGASGSSTSGTWGIKTFNTVNGGIGESTKSVGQAVSEGKIVKIYALTRWAQRGPSDWGIDHTDWRYIWKDDNYTLTDADKSDIKNNFPSQFDYSSTPEQIPHTTLSYNSGNI